jgi:hypothetical protein
MASSSATMSTNPITTTPSLHPPLTFRDRLRFALFMIIPVYAQFCVSPSISSALQHIYIVGTTGICIVHFSGDIVGGEIINLGLVGDIVYGLAISCFPRLIKSYSLTAWIIPKIGGWRATVMHWAIIVRFLTYLLPENYGSKVEVRSVRSIRFDTRTDVVLQNRYFSRISNTYIPDWYIRWDLLLNRYCELSRV